MRVLLLLIALLVPKIALAVPVLQWDPVTLGADGEPLSPGNEVREYRVYGCPTGNECSVANGVVVATVPGSETSVDLAGQRVPQRYAVTAVNASGESAESHSVKVIPPDFPRSNRLR
jgi:hypothetical protein